MSGPRTLETLGGARGDLSLFVRNARDLIKGPPVTCAPATPVSEGARLMTARGIGSVVVADSAGAPIGIVTDRDLRSRVVARGLPGNTPVTAIMSSPLQSVGPAVRAFEALLEMTRGGFHHLGVVEEGRLIGVVSSHDMLGLRTAHPVGLAREIEIAVGLQRRGKGMLEAGVTPLTDADAHVIGLILALRDPARSAGGSVAALPGGDASPRTFTPAAL